MLINLKPRSQRSADAPARSSAACSARRRQRAGHHALHAAGAGPDHRFDGQPHPVPVRAAERPTRAISTVWVPRLMDRLQRAARDRRRRHRPAGQGPVGLHRGRPRHRRALRHHRRHGRQRAVRRLRPAHRLDHLHPVQPVSRDPRGRPDDAAARSIRCRTSICPAAGGKQVPLSAIATFEERTAPLADRPSGPVPGHHHLLQPGAGLFAGPAVDAIQRRASARSACRRSITTHFQGAALAFQKALDSQLLLILAAIVTVYIVLGVLYESYIHPDHDPVDPAVGRHRRAAGADDRRATISASSPSSASCC